MPDHAPATHYLGNHHITPTPGPAPPAWTSFGRYNEWLGQAAHRSDNSMVKQLLVGTRIPGHLVALGCIML